MKQTIMRRTRFFILPLIIIATFCLNSCGEIEPIDPVLINPNPNTGTASGVFKVDFDGKTFVATSVQALVNDSYIAISGLKTPSGELVQIALPAPYNKVGTYTWKSIGASGGLIGLAYMPSNGTEPFTGDAKGSGGASDFSGYTDTATITISKIDVTNKKISGTFQFTGVKFKDITATSIETKIFTNGSFTEIPFTTDTPVPVTNNSFSAKLDGVIFTPIYITALNSTGNINIIARKGVVENISLSFPNTIVPGTYILDSFGDNRGQYIKANNADGSGLFGADVGSVTITSHDKANKKIVGTFKFTANSFIVSEKHTITEGTFSVSY